MHHVLHVNIRHMSGTGVTQAKKYINNDNNNNKKMMVRLQSIHFMAHVFTNLSLHKMEQCTCTALQKPGDYLHVRGYIFRSFPLAFFFIEIFRMKLFLFAHL